jgi:hypothetical protein
MTFTLDKVGILILGKEEMVMFLSNIVETKFVLLDFDAEKSLHASFLCNLEPYNDVVILKSHNFIDWILC